MVSSMESSGLRVVCMKYHYDNSSIVSYERDNLEPVMGLLLPAIGAGRIGCVVCCKMESGEVEARITTVFVIKITPVNRINWWMPSGPLCPIPFDDVRIVQPGWTRLIRKGRIVCRPHCFAREVRVEVARKDRRRMSDQRERCLFGHDDQGVADALSIHTEDCGVSKEKLIFGRQGYLYSNRISLEEWDNVLIRLSPPIHVADLKVGLRFVFNGSNRSPVGRDRHISVAAGDCEVGGPCRKRVIHREQNIDNCWSSQLDRGKMPLVVSTPSCCGSVENVGIDAEVVGRILKLVGGACRSKHSSFRVESIATGAGTKEVAVHNDGSWIVSYSSKIMCRVVGVRVLGKGVR
mmetsp:Transcript_3399/g.4636  ORF Transcript_3399/g.4636 Transcript_3399/m.4636 type:complete len:349 (+) Transcript_3399:161-1207(+)